MRTAGDRPRSFPIVCRRSKWPVNFGLLLPLIESTQLSDEDKQFVKASLWRDGATPEITSHEQNARYQRIAGELARKYAAETRSSLEFIRSPDGVLLTSLEAGMAEWDTLLGAMLSRRPRRKRLEAAVPGAPAR